MWVQEVDEVSCVQNRLCLDSKYMYPCDWYIFLTVHDVYM